MALQQIDINRIVSKNVEKIMTPPMKKKQTPRSEQRKKILCAKNPSHRRPSTIAYETICSTIDSQLKDLDAAAEMANEILDDSFDLTNLSLSPTLLTPNKDDLIDGVESTVSIEWTHIDTPEAGEVTKMPCEVREESKTIQEIAAVEEDTKGEIVSQHVATRKMRNSRRVSSHMKQSSGLSCKICVVS